MVSNLIIYPIYDQIGVSVSEEALEKMSKLDIAPEDYVNEISSFECDEEDRPMSTETFYDGNFCFEKRFISAEGKIWLNEVDGEFISISDLPERGSAPNFECPQRHMMKEEELSSKINFDTLKDEFGWNDEQFDSKKLSVEKYTNLGIPAVKLFYNDDDITESILYADETEYGDHWVTEYHDAQ